MFKAIDEVYDKLKAKAINSLAHRYNNSYWISTNYGTSGS